ncbi:phosphate ABC transporter substrate-binding protein PstS [Asticcacaulis sp. BYS171W]|uniref:Phosphate-binding protein PstS n=1 Tax=Asticcacaulis aquaticus TaxID=2984212 RepID=A0ABT5HW97_9CAUL|nr:phosphate ABC transporter substrate-binding protein PstS [Asticcacaulis aquaticus]MDC7684203.1 phosphate ABC transporter substrate-binding protein PstS [Asticcacaulis aquaticus]
MFKPFAAAVGALVLLAACSSGEAPKTEAPASGGLTGAGSTFFAPLASKWAETFKGATASNVNYQSIGSGGGIKQIKAKTVDFGASDKPLSVEDLNAAGLYQFPVVMGGVVPVVNVPGVAAGKLNLTGQVLADIFMGKIKRWDDAALKALNPGLALPNLPITVVHRADGSGTTYLFTNYLAAVSAEWKSAVGASDALEWPTGLGGKGNEGVSAFVAQTTGSIGYVEFAYAVKTGAAYANLTNHDGQTVAPSAESFAAAAAGADWSKAPGNQLLLLDQPGAKSWPITGAVFVLVYKDQADAAKAKATLNFFDWAYTSGDAAAAELHYVPMPAEVKALIRAQWAKEITSGGQPVYVPAAK